MTTLTAPDLTPVQSLRWMVWTGRILSGLFVLFMLFDSTIKLLGLEVVGETMARLGYPVWTARPIGVIELLALALYVFPRTAVLGAILLTGVMGGAVATHLRVGDPLFSHLLFGVYLGVAMWGGLWLRDARLRGLMPWRG